MTQAKLRGMVAALVLAAAGACAGAPDVPPLPDLTGVEPSIADAVREAREAVVAAPGSGPRWGALGDRLSVHGWHEEASRCYGVAARLDPARFAWPYRRARSLVQAADLDAAAAAFRAALALDDGYAPAHLGYGETLARLGDADGARDHLLRALALDPGNLHAELRLGELDNAARRYREAVDRLEAVVGGHPRVGEAHAALALAYHALGDEERSARHAELARALPATPPPADPRGTPETTPAGARAQVEEGHRLEDAGDLEGAARAYQAALDVNPGLINAHVALGSVLDRLDRPEEALAHLETAARLRPGDVAVIESFGRQLAAAGRTREAVPVLNRAIQLAPERRDLQLEAGRLLLLAEEPAAAVGRLEPLVDSDAGDVAARVALSEAAMELGDDRRAFELLRDALRVAPDDAEALAGLGDLALRRGRWADALTTYRHARKVHPESIGAARRLGWVLATHPDPRERDPEAALALLGEARAATPGDPLVLDAEAAALAALGRFDEAARRAGEAKAAAERREMSRRAAAIAERLRLYEQGRPFVLGGR